MIKNEGEIKSILQYVDTMIQDLNNTKEVLESKLVGKDVDFNFDLNDYKGPLEKEMNSLLVDISFISVYLLMLVFSSDPCKIYHARRTISNIRVKFPVRAWFNEVEYDYFERAISKEMKRSYFWDHIVTILKTEMDDEIVELPKENIFVDFNDIVELSSVEMVEGRFGKLKEIILQRIGGSNE